MEKPVADLVLVPLASPLLAGVYLEGKLVRTYEEEGKSSDVLAPLYEKIQGEYDVANVYFARGPGSYMAIKLAYVFLRTLQVAKGIGLFAVDGFYFTGGEPIKAAGKRWFKKEGGEIVTFLPETEPQTRFSLPPELKREDFSQPVDPLYILPPV